MRLPWTYWLIFGAGLAVVLLLSAAIALTLGFNPYVAALIAGVYWVLREIWIARRR